MTRSFNEPSSTDGLSISKQRKGMLLTKWSQVLVATVLLLLVGCPAPTPAERITQLGGEITVRDNQVIDLNLSNTNVTDADMSYINGLCSNSGGRWKALHTLDLSDTSITDDALEFMARQNGYAGPDGIKVLVLSNTQTTETAISNLKERWPKCEIRK